MLIIKIQYYILQDPDSFGVYEIEVLKNPMSDFERSMFNQFVETCNSQPATCNFGIQHLLVANSNLHSQVKYR